MPELLSVGAPYYKVFPMAASVVITSYSSVTFAFFSDVLSEMNVVGCLKDSTGVPVTVPTDQMSETTHIMI